jgi:outer membrane protein assembly factor BamB
MSILLNSAFHKSVLWIALIFLGLTWFSCKKNDPAPSLKGITSFTLLRDSNVVVQSVNVIKDDSLIITVPGTISIHGLSTQIGLASGASVSPASGVSEDFAQPVIYTVTLSDGSTKNYIVKVIPDKLKNIVYVGTSNGTFYALDAKTGSSLWTKPTGGNFYYSSPALADGIIYTGNTDGKMYAYTAGPGELVWTYQTGSSIESSPAVNGENVYFGSDDHYFYAVNAKTGTLNWRFSTGFNVSSSPLVYNGVVYFGSDDNNFYALDANSGTLKWKYSTNSMFNASSPVQLNGIIYIGNRDGNFYALDAATGQPKWAINPDGTSFEMARPVIVNGIIYVTSWYKISNFNVAGSFYAINAETGAVVWTVLPGTGFSSGPDAADGKLFISADGGNFYALDQKTGNILWNDQIYPNGAMPTVKNGVAFVGGGGSGYFYAFGENDGTIKWKVKISGLSTSKPYVIDANGN